MVIKSFEKGAEDLIQYMIAHEWAFRLTNEDRDSEIVVCFHKGTWGIGHYTRWGDKTSFTEGFSIIDSYAIETCENPLLRGLLTALFESAEKDLKKSSDPCRDIPARVICKAIQIWGFALSEIGEMEILQNSRNSFIDFSTGAIALNH